MDSGLTVGSWFTMHDGCPVSCDVGGSGQAYFVFGNPGDGVDFTFESEALREFVRLGAEALSEMDARYTKEEADRREQDTGVGTPVRVGERSV